MSVAFITFKLQGAQFLAIPADRDRVHIIGQSGFNYGSWMDAENFKRNYRQCTARGSCVNQLGKVKLSFQILD